MHIISTLMQCFLLRTVLKERVFLSSSSLYASASMSSSSSSSSSSDDTKISSAMNDIFYSDNQNTFSVYVTGGGSIAIANILQVPGASNSFISGQVPYSHSALQELIHNDKDVSSSSPGSCSPEMAIKISKAAYKKTVELILEENSDLGNLVSRNIFGIGCTAAIVSSQPKKGPHRCHVASSNYNQHKVFSIELEKGRRTREGEDRVCGNLVLDMIMANSIISNSKPSSSFMFTKESLASSNSGIEIITETVHDSSDIIDSIYSRKIGHALFVKKKLLASKSQDTCPDSSLSGFHYYEDITLPRNTIVYSGSFNPLHEGHVKLVIAAIEKLGLQSPLVVFEIAAVNADKPPLAREEIVKRLQQFDTKNNELFKQNGLTNIGVSITSEPLFLGKSQIFKNCNFLIGADTLVRLIDSKYYNQSSTNMVSALSIIHERKCSFVVGGRYVGDNFSTAEMILSSEKANTLPTHIRSMFISVPEDEFRVDLSSTQLRNQRNSL